MLENQLQLLKKKYTIIDQIQDKTQKINALNSEVDTILTNIESINEKC